MNLLEVRNLTKSYPVPRRLTDIKQRSRVVVNDVSFNLAAGSCLGVVGESGAGKSTLGRLVLRLIEADSGHINFSGEDLRSIGRRQLRSRRRDMQMIFQDPYSSVDPRMTVAQTVLEPLRAHGHDSGESPSKTVSRLLDTVGLVANYADRYPAELSGGQLQRVSIARALALEPRLIVCDEPVTALDVSIRAQVINLLLDLKQEFGFAYLFISHDLSVVETIADDVVVMRQGVIEEYGTVEDIFTNPTQKYTQELLAAVPNPVPQRRGVIHE